MSKLVFSVPDMSCNHCIMRISKALESAGLNGFEISLEEKTVTVEAPDAETVRAVMDEAGYDAVLKS